MIDFVMNILWDIFGGLISALLWCIFGVLWCITVIGIPLGIVCFKMAGLVIAPFGREFEYDGGPLSIIFDIFWILLTGIEFAALHVALGIVLCVTIIGIPFGIQHFKLAVLSLLPFGGHFR